MARASFTKTKFQLGQWSSYMYGRADMPEFEAALKLCQNYVPGDEGGIRRRFGVEQEFYTGDPANRARLIPYLCPSTNMGLSETDFHVFPTTMLTVGVGFITASRASFVETRSENDPSKTITSISTANPAVVTLSGVHNWTTGDIVQLSAPFGLVDVVQAQITVTGANTFTIPWPGVSLQSASLVTAIRYYKVNTSYTATQLINLDYVQVGSNLWFLHPTIAPAYGNFSDASGISHPKQDPTGLTASSFVDGPYMDLNTTTTTFTPSGVGPGAITIVASSIVGINVSTGNTGTGFKTTDVGRIFRMQDAAGNWTWGIITARNSSTNISVTMNGPALSSVVATANWRMGMFSDTTGWPYAGAVYQDRLYFAHENAFPFTADQIFSIVASKVGAYQDFTPTSADGTVADDNAIVLALSDAGATKISWFQVYSNSLLIGTPVGGYTISGTSLGEPITPTNIQISKVHNLQCDNSRPVQTPTGIAFIHSSRQKISEYSDAFGAVELTKWAREVIGTGFFAELSFQRSPQYILWARTTDDLLYGAAYKRTNNEPQCGWFSAPLLSGDTIESIGVHLFQDSSAVIHEDLRMIVLINGYRRHMVLPYQANLLAIYDAGTGREGKNFGNALFMDESFPFLSTGSGTSPHTFTNFQTLRNRTIAAASNGVPQTDANGNDNIVVAANGSFQLSGGDIVDSFIFSVGLRMQSRLQLLRPEAGTTNGPALGKTRRIDQFAVLVEASAAFRAGANFTDMYEYQFTATPLSGFNVGVLQRYSGVYESALQADYDFDNEIAIEQNKPAPGLFTAIGGFITVSERQ